MIKFPAQIDDIISLPSIDDNSILGTNFNLLRDAVLSIESELGVQPSGVYSTVRERLIQLEQSISNLSVITLATDLGGTLSNPKVIGLQGRPLTSQTPQFNDVIAWNGVAWVYKTVVDSGISIVGAQQGSIIYYNGTNWVQLSPGTSGNYLKTLGVNQNPIWDIVPGATSVFNDDVFTIRDNLDNTKQLKFQISGVSAGTVRTITVPNANITIDGNTDPRPPNGLAGGDLQGSYPNPTIINNAITTFKIGANAVTYSRLQQLPTGSVIGRYTAGTGNAETLTLNSTIDVTGGVLQRAAITGDVTIAAGSNTSVLASNAVTTIKILDGNVTYQKLQQVSGNSILGNPTASQDEVNEIFLDGFTLDFNAGNLRVKPRGITATEMFAVTTDRLLGRDSPGNGNVEQISLDSTLSWSGTGIIGRSAISGDVTIASGSNTATVTDLTITNETAGSLLYFNGTNWVRLPPGNDGYILRTTSNVPEWVDGFSKDEQFARKLGSRPDFILWAEDLSAADGYSNGTVVNQWKSRLNPSVNYFIGKNSPTMNTTGFNNKRAVNLSVNQFLDGYLPGLTRVDGYTSDNDCIWTTRDSFTLIMAFNHNNNSTQYVFNLGSTTAAKQVGLFIDNPTKRPIPTLNTNITATDVTKIPTPANVNMILVWVKKDEGSTFSNSQYKLYSYYGNFKHREIIQGASPTLDLLNNLTFGTAIFPTGSAPSSTINLMNLRFASLKFGHVATETEVDDAVNFIKSSSGYDCPV